MDHIGTIKALIRHINAIDDEYNRALRGSFHSDPRGQVMLARQYAKRAQMRLDGASDDEVAAQLEKDVEEYEQR